MESHDERVRLAFTAQADSYAESAVIAAEEARRQFVAFVAPQPTDRILDIATGPGFLAFLFAGSAAQVAALDLTPAMLRRAHAAVRDRRLANVHLLAGSAEILPCPAATVDVVTCGSAFHHFADPARVLAEMIRVTRPGGRVALIDIITSEHSGKALLHNTLERMRDPSHTRSLPLSELVALFGRAGLRDLRAATYTTAREIGEWLAISRTPPAIAEEVRARFLSSIDGDATGLDVRQEGDIVRFNHTFAWVVGTLPRPAGNA